MANDQGFDDDFNDRYKGKDYDGDKDEIHEILHDLQIAWPDFIVRGDSDNDPEHYRPGEYSTPEEALIDYYERGLGEYIEIYYDPDCDCYEVYLAYEDGK